MSRKRGVGLFRHMLCIDLKRCLRSVRFWTIVLSIGILTLIGETGYGTDLLLFFRGYDTSEGIVELLTSSLMFDRFKVVYVILLSSIYTGSFCREETSGNLRMILARVDITDYTQSKFIANTLGIITAAIFSFFCFTLALIPHRALASHNYANSGYHYLYIMEQHPLWYIFMVGLEFGMIVAAFSAMGMLFSVYQSNLFVSIGLPGLLFFALASVDLPNSPFDVYQMISMGHTLTRGGGDNVWIDYGWGLLFPFLVILLCGRLFYQRLRWRLKNGLI